VRVLSQPHSALKEVNISFLNGSSREKNDITRHLYIYKKDNNHQWLQSNRFIHLDNEFDDLEEILKQGKNKLESLMSLDQKS